MNKEIVTSNTLSSFIKKIYKNNVLVSTVDRTAKVYSIQIVNYFSAGCRGIPSIGSCHGCVYVQKICYKQLKQLSSVCQIKVLTSFWFFYFSFF